MPGLVEASIQEGLQRLQVSSFDLQRGWENAKASLGAWRELADGKVDYDGFRWSSSLPLAHPHLIPFTWAAYFVTIFGLQFLMKTRKTGFGLVYCTALHNLVLCLWSLAMFVGLAYEMVQRATKANSVSAIFCEPIGSEAGRGPIFYWIYIYYLSKFYELFDTVIMVLKKKPLNFLHVFHHSSVILMVWSWLESGIIFSSQGMIFNTFIHVWMYLYYMVSALQIRVPGPLKKAITQGQIIQFVSSFLLLIPFFMHHAPAARFDASAVPRSLLPFTAFLDGVVDAFKYEPQCAGARGLGLSAFLNFSFLLLFIRFHRQTYRGGKSTAGGRSASSKEAKQRIRKAE
eukprot:tig00021621_g22966.t1